MEKIDLFTLAVLFSLFGFMTCIMFNQPITAENITIENITEIQEIQNIANEVSDMFVFTKHKFMCIQFAKALQNRLKQKNYTAFYCEGVIRNSPRGHAWIEVVINQTIIPIESITGELIKEEKYKEKYLNKTCENNDYKNYQIGKRLRRELK